MTDQLRENALHYHKFPTPGKIAVVPTKPMATQRDLALAYTPGVAKVCEEIAANPDEARNYTSRGNLVAVITNGTAVLGLGNIGPLASKPVMEGKAVLFKKFSGVDAIDIEINELDPDKLIEIIAALEPSFGGINLEDIKSPECFEIEQKLKERMNIPVFHDDQHGTAIIAAAAVVNWLHITDRVIEEVKLSVSGAGAAAMACLNLLVDLGMKRENITVTDRKGVLYKGRAEYMDPHKERYARETDARTLADTMDGADAFLGVSAAGILKPEMIKGMAKNPLILAMANPVPEIMPEEVEKVRSDVIMATGRSDFPNQVNNVLCFPFIFRGALDVGATTINEEMKIACVHALAELARAEVHHMVTAAYGEREMNFGKDYLIPTPFDPRLILTLAPAVAQAAMDSGVATRPIKDMAAYKKQLSQTVFGTGLLMGPVFERASQDPKKLVYAEGEEINVLRAVQEVCDERVGKPILIGRRKVIESRIEKLGLRLKMDQDFELVDPEDDPRYKEYWTEYYQLTHRSGVTESSAKTIVRTNTTVIAALMVHRGEADSLICGTVGGYDEHLKDICSVIGLADDVQTAAAMNAVILSTGTFFICDTNVTPNPSAEVLCQNTLLAAEQVRRFGLEPKVALLSHSNFGTHDDESARKMRDALTLIRQQDKTLEIDGEMKADIALSDALRKQIFPNSNLKGKPNLLMMPSLSAASIAFNMVKILGDGFAIGPLLLGVKKPAHILNPSVTVRGILNVSALATVEAQTRIT